MEDKGMETKRYIYIDNRMRGKSPEKRLAMHACHKRLFIIVVVIEKYFMLGGGREALHSVSAPTVCYETGPRCRRPRAPARKKLHTLSHSEAVRSRRGWQAQSLGCGRH